LNGSLPDLRFGYVNRQPSGTGPQEQYNVTAAIDIENFTESRSQVEVLGWETTELRNRAAVGRSVGQVASSPFGIASCEPSSDSFYLTSKGRAKGQKPSEETVEVVEVKGSYV
jgi:hypothetical protein